MPDPFIPTMAQIEFLRSLHYRNIILKARQLGFTTAIAIYFLDCALFRENIRAGVVAHTDDAAKKIFRDKYKFAYENLPPSLRNAMPLKRDSADELMFAHNGSSIKVSTSMRSGTLQYLHVSEFGKICAEFPKRADEVITGSIPTVSSNGIVIIESTAEGRVGHFFNMVEVAKKNRCLTKLSRKQYKLQMEVSDSVAAQLAAGEERIVGVMVESHLVEGRQDIVPDKALTYGQSVTDACIGWDDSVKVLDQLAAAVRARRVAEAAE